MSCRFLVLVNFVGGVLKRRFILILCTVLCSSVGWFLCWNSAPIINVTIIESNTKSICYAKLGLRECCELPKRLSSLLRLCAPVGLDEWPVWNISRWKMRRNWEEFTGNVCMDRTAWTLVPLWKAWFDVVMWRNRYIHEFEALKLGHGME